MREAGIFEMRGRLGTKKKTRKLRSVHFRCYVGYLKLFAIAYIYVDAKMEVEFLLSCKYINIQ